MSINNLKKISDFSKNNNNYSDFNLVSNLLLNLNFTKYRSNKKSQVLKGGNIEGQMPLDPTQMIPGVVPQIIHSQMPLDPTQMMPSPIPQIPGVILDQSQGQSINPMMGVSSQGSIQENLVQGKKCREEMIQNPDGTFIKREICDNYMSMFPNMYLPKPNFVSGEIKTYTIPKGTVLYHSVDNKRGFNTNNIQLGNNGTIIFFTPNFRLASDRIQGCSIDKQKGYIHAFEVIQDIPNIYIKLPYDTSEDVSIETLKQEFCGGTGSYNGVGFFYPKNEIELFNKTILSSESIVTSLTEEYFYSEFGLCNPTPYIKYLYSQKCQSLRKLSQPYRFDKYGLD